MKPTTKGVVDVVFCLDASGSMAPCIDGVRRNVGAFLDGLGLNAGRAIDCRIDFLAHSCDEAGILMRSDSLRRSGLDLVAALYGQKPDPSAFFTSNPTEVRAALNAVGTYGDEAMLVALDLCLDFPWRPRGGCHRVVVMLTDEPLETNADAKNQRRMVGSLIDKIHALGVMLFLVGPESAGFNELAEADKSQYQQVGQTQDGLGSLDFARVLSHIGKSVSVSQLQGSPDKPVRRAVRPGRWTPSQSEIRGGSETTAGDNRAWSASTALKGESRATPSRNSSPPGTTYGYAAAVVGREKVFFKLYQSPSIRVPWYKPFVQHRANWKDRVESGPCRQFCYRFLAASSTTGSFTRSSNSSTRATRSRRFSTGSGSVPPRCTGSSAN